VPIIPKVEQLQSQQRNKHYNEKSETPKGQQTTRQEKEATAKEKRYKTRESSKHTITRVPRNAN
jgi:hypothetical protein